MAGDSRYLDVVRYWRDQIFTEQIKPGDTFPSRRELMELHKTSRATIDKAMAMLRAERLVKSRQGEATIVLKRPRIGQPTGAARVRRMEKGGGNYGNGETSTNHRAEMRPCGNPDIARDLGLDPHDDVVVRVRTFVQDGVPTIWATSVVHPRALEVVPELLNQGKLPVWWQTLYVQRTGETIVRSPELRGACLASAEEKEALQIDPRLGQDVPVLVLHTVFHDSHGPLEFWRDVYAPGLWYEGEVI